MVGIGQGEGGRKLEIGWAWEWAGKTAIEKGMRNLVIS